MPHFRARAAPSEASSLSHPRGSVLGLLLSTLSQWDGETTAHMERIGLGAEFLGRQLGRSDAGPNLRAAATLHDIGKVAVPVHLVRKPGALTPPELEQVRCHTWFGAHILAKQDVPYRGTAVSIALHHHERWDGSGYPTGLRGSEIPLAARIVSVIDVYDALIHDRPYRSALDEREALDIIERDRGRAFDPDVVDAFLENLAEIRRIERTHRDHSPSVREIPASATNEGERSERHEPEQGLLRVG